jgi:nucleoid DNA-binding protein
LIREVAKHSGYKIYEVEDIANKLAYVIREAMKQKLSVHYRGLGTFTCKTHKARNVISGLTGREFQIPSRYVVKVTFDKSLKELAEAAMNEPSLDLSGAYTKGSDE